MDEFLKKSVDEQVGGTDESIKGTIKQGPGKLAGDRDSEAEGQIEQGEGKMRENMGKAGRAVSDAVERVKDKLRGYDED